MEKDKVVDSIENTSPADTIDAFKAQGPRPTAAESA